MVFADTREIDVAEYVAFAEQVEHLRDMRLTVFVPITDELDGDVHADLRAGGWKAPFVMTPMARAYVPAMLEPGTPTPWVRLATVEGRIVAEGPVGEETRARMMTAAGAR